jgi:3-oxoacyl-[acyl-carrier protein] reductase
LDFGIKEKQAIVCASSKGLGRSCAISLAQCGVDLVLNARNIKPLEETAEYISKNYHVKVKIVLSDITTQYGYEKLLSAIESPDILINNVGGPPPCTWSNCDLKQWENTIKSNLLTPIKLITAVLPGMISRKWGRIINITSSSVKSPIPHLILSNTARSGLTGFVGSTARQVAKYGITINNLLPGFHETDRMNGLLLQKSIDRGISIDQIRKEKLEIIPTHKFGDPSDFGATCAFICSEYAKFIVGQNILLDGGAFNSTMS